MINYLNVHIRAFTLHIADDSFTRSKMAALMNSASVCQKQKLAGRILISSKVIKRPFNAGRVSAAEVERETAVPVARASNESEYSFEQ